jgi:hypothetical protein
VPEQNMPKVRCTRTQRVRGCDYHTHTQLEVGVSSARWIGVDVGVDFAIYGSIADRSGVLHISGCLQRSFGTTCVVKPFRIDFQCSIRFWWITNQRLLWLVIWQRIPHQRQTYRHQISLSASVITGRNCLVLGPRLSGRIFRSRNIGRVLHSIVTCSAENKLQLILRNWAAAKRK